MDFLHKNVKKGKKYTTEITFCVLGLLHHMWRCIRSAFWAENELSKELGTVVMKYQGLSNASCAQKLNSTDHMTIISCLVTFIVTHI